MKAKHNHKDCQLRIKEKIDKICEQKNLNLTPIRKRVLEIIAASHKALKAYDILSKLKEEGFSDKPPTVYRALDFLIEQKAIYKLSKVNAYAASFNEKSQDFTCFLICDKCLSAEECYDVALLEAVRKLAEKRKIKNLEVELEFRCANC